MQRRAEVDSALLIYGRQRPLVTHLPVSVRVVPLEEIMRQGYGHMVVDDYVRRLRELDARRRERLGEISTPAAARAYCDQVKRRARACLGPMTERTPLKAAVTGQLLRDGYRIEKLTLESRDRKSVV